MSRRAQSLLLALAIAATAPSQRPTGVDPVGTGHRQQPGTPAPVHDPQPMLPPRVALAHLRAGNDALAASLAARRPAPKPRRRPSGAGRYLAAVIVCSDAGVDPAELFGCPRRDLLVLSNPGARVDAAITATLERLARTERLSLCVVLTHADCPSLPLQAGATKAARALHRQAEPARQLSRSRHCPLERAQALVQREHLLAASTALRRLTAEDRLRVVPASVSPRSQQVRWHTTRAEEAPIAPIK